MTGAPSLAIMKNAQSIVEGRLILAVITNIRSIQNHWIKFNSI